MDGNSHMIVGLLLSTILVYFVFHPTLFEMLIFPIFGALCALVPDLDHQASKGRKILDISFILLTLSFVYLNTCNNSICIPQIPSLSGMIISFFAFLGMYLFFFTFLKPTHRGITHTIVACFVFGVLIYFALGLKFAVVGFVGYFSHLLADCHIKLI